MNLLDLYSLEGGAFLDGTAFMYKILEERPLEHGISHREMPTFKDHIEFVNNKPFRYWYIIEYEGSWIGMIECLPTNEFGVHLLKAYQGKGLGGQAVNLFMATHEPLPAIPAVRNGHWLANCSPFNTAAIQFFEGLGFHEIQRTLQYD